MGQEVDGVHVSDGQDASDVLGSEAYTAGQDIAFAAGEYAPTAPDPLLAHELSHTIQQGAWSGGQVESAGAELSEE